MIYYLLAALFNIWMLYDAFRRRVPAYWFFVIVFVPAPLGGLLYYLACNWRKLAALGGASAYAELEARAQAEPTSENLLTLAEALEANGVAERAEELFRSVLAREPHQARALHGLSRALLSLDRAAEACGYLAQLLTADSAFANYGAALDYAEALAQSGSVKEAVELLDGLVLVAPRINHRVALAHYLILDGQFGLAEQELQRALRVDAAGVPDEPMRARWLKRAQKMLNELATAR